MHIHKYPGKNKNNNYNKKTKLNSGKINICIE